MATASRGNQRDTHLADEICTLQTVKPSRVPEGSARL